MYQITHHFSQWIANQLNPLIQNLQWILKVTNEFLKEIHKINSEKNSNNHSLPLLIYSADVEALYPNMNVQLGLTLTEKLFIKIERETPEKTKLLIQAMIFVFTQE